MNTINKEKLEEVQRNNDISFGPYEESKMTAGQLLSCLEVADEEAECKHDENPDKYTPELFKGTMEALDKLTSISYTVCTCETRKGGCPVHVKPAYHCKDNCPQHMLPLIEERDRYKLALQEMADMNVSQYALSYMRGVARKAVGEL